MSKIVFPEKPSKVAKDPFELTSLYYGPPGIGKTTLLMASGKPLFLKFEPGRKALSNYGIQIKNWKHVKNIVDGLEEQRPDYTGVVFDTGDMMYDLAEQYVCEKMAIDSPADEAYGKGWSAVRREIKKVALQIMRAEYTVTFISHDKRTADDDDVNPGKITPTMPKTASKVIFGLCDLMVYMTYKKGERVMYIRGTEKLEAKCTPNYAFKGVKKVKMGDSAEEACANLRKAFKGRV